MALHHDTHDILLAVFQLGGYVAGDFHLAGVVFAAVGVAEIDHQARGNTGFGELCGSGLDVFGTVIRLFAAAQDDVAVGIAGGVDDGGVAGFGYGEKMVGMGGCADGIDGDFEVAVGTVFEADGTGKAGGKLSVHLAFGSACTDGAPRDEVGVILRRNHVEKLGGGWHTEVVQIEQQAAGLAQAEVDVETAVEVGVVDEAFPADGGARFFEINSHNDEQLALVFFTQGKQTPGVFEGGFGVVDGAGTDDDEQAVAAAAHKIGNLAAGGFDQLGGGFADGEFVEVGDGGEEFADAADAYVVGAAEGLVVVHGDVCVGLKKVYFESVWVILARLATLRPADRQLGYLKICRDPFLIPFGWPVYFADYLAILKLLLFSSSLLCL